MGELDQLFLLDDLFEDKIYTARKSLMALKELEKRAINDNYIGKRENEINIVILNVQNLIHHIEDVKHHNTLLDQNLIILSETWIPTADINVNRRYSLPNY